MYLVDAAIFRVLRELRHDGGTNRLRRLEGRAVRVAEPGLREGTLTEVVEPDGAAADEVVNNFLALLAQERRQLLRRSRSTFALNAPASPRSDAKTTTAARVGFSGSVVSTCFALE